MERDITPDSLNGRRRTHILKRELCRESERQRECATESPKCRVESDTEEAKTNAGRLCRISVDEILHCGSRHSGDSSGKRNCLKYYIRN